MAAGLVAAPAAAAERVLVAGATGRTGAALMVELKKQGYDVRGLVRDAARAKEELGEGYELVEADVRKKRQVAAAFAGGVDYVISAIGSRGWVGANSPQFVDYVGTKNLADAAKAAGVKHFVVISVGNAGPAYDHASNAALGYLGYWKTRGEDAVKASGVAYTIVGPGGLEDGEQTTKGIKLTSRADYKTARINVGDTAMLAIDALKNPGQRNKSYGAVHDAALPRDAWKQAVAGLSEEKLGLPPLVIDQEKMVSIDALDPADAPIQRFMFTAYGIWFRGQEIAIPGSDAMFCTVSNEHNTLLNWFPRDRAWKFQVLYDPDADTPSGALATCEKRAPG
ncbi:MAG: SDR family oxidoreductase [Rhodospirillaceae bacterium]|nr:SDR family oxidoreductase [Rhodospirillaceae bacterium]